MNVRLRKNIVKTTNAQGFTIIELLIATTIFSVILLVATAGIVSIGRLYYKGTSEAKTQEVTRNLSEELTRSIQFNNGQKVIESTNPTQVVFCIGDTRYTYSIDKPVSTAITPDAPNTSAYYAQGIVAERIGAGTNCSLAVTPRITDTSNVKQLLGENMRMFELKTEPVAGSVDTWNVKVRVGFGTSDLFTHYNEATNTTDFSVASTAKCKAGISGGSFCATAQLDTIVKKRVL